MSEKVIAIVTYLGEREWNTCFQYAFHFESYTKCVSSTGKIVWGKNELKIESKEKQIKLVNDHTALILCVKFQTKSLETWELSVYQQRVQCHRCLLALQIIC